MRLDELKKILIFIGFTEERAKHQLVLLGVIAEKRAERSNNTPGTDIEAATIREYFDNVTRVLPFSKKEYVKSKLDTLLK